ncbi:sigma-B regulation protein RsbU (phosphoserine phosphatase) [Oceanobacillus limi]|uniref:Sigma-B regulation protein RsbU (Phosphoserine phosphatase) n=1 Tax=Oceanobacillus limi TaxID=930131 RepID=A0A1I0H6X2_9BACI|nr:PP2C family protein-serine/threonine phosphatase [Oceanobacillus limi]SET79505.1 sigma-B regulation protein RsbU (phosphoserine phosphatase) [Oceanobacillus limi]
MDTLEFDRTNYKELLKKYIETKDEQSLYGAEQISKSFIKNNILPEEIVNLHIQAMIELYPGKSKEIYSSMNFLLETMISYGLAHQEYQSLREKQLELQSEISVAASMQNTLLATSVPKVDDLDIGVISVPAHQMNGDYHHLVTGKDGTIGIAVADVIGKGIPAALCMSMIKYSLESFSEQSANPKLILENLNRVVERNVETGMFITMFYAQYNPSTSILHYASAGHEPGYYFNAEKNNFEEINAKGLVLGVSSDTKYEQYELTLNKGDMVVLLTDGVTECRNNGKFIESEEVIEVIKNYAHLPAQEAVNQVYKYFERLQEFQLKDDFTLIMMKKNV